MSNIKKFEEYGTDISLNENYNLQDVCDDCCDDLNINNEYISSVFQWLEDNDYVLTKND